MRFKIGIESLVSPCQAKITWTMTWGPPRLRNPPEFGASIPIQHGIIPIISWSRNHTLLIEKASPSQSPVKIASPLCLAKSYQSLAIWGQLPLSRHQTKPGWIYGVTLM